MVRRSENSVVDENKDVATAAINRYDPDAEQINFYAVVPDFGGGMMMLAEFVNKHSQNRHEYFVHVKDGSGWVFSDYAMAMRVGTKQSDTLSKIVSPDFVTAVLTMILIGGFLYLAFSKEHKGTDEAKALATALTTVLGFWFGRQTK